MDAGCSDSSDGAPSCINSGDCPNECICEDAFTTAGTCRSISTGNACAGTCDRDTLCPDGTSCRLEVTEGDVEFHACLPDGAGGAGGSGGAAGFGGAGGEGGVGGAVSPCNIPLPEIAFGANLQIDIYAILDTRPGGLSFDEGGSLYVGNVGLSEDNGPVPVLRVSAQGAVSELAEIVGPDVLIVDRAGAIAGAAGNVLVGGINSEMNGQITEMTPAATIANTIVDACLGTINHLTIDMNGRLLVTNFDEGSVCVVDGGMASTLIAEIQGGGPGETTIEDPVTRALYVSSEDAVYTYDAAGNLQALQPLTDGTALAFGTSVPFEGLLIRRSDTLLVRDLTNDEETLLIAGSIGLHATFDARGHLYLSDMDNQRVLRVAPTGSVGPTTVCPSQ